MDDLKETILKYVIEEYADEDDKITFSDEDASPEAFDNVNKIADLVTRFIS
jgi:hypothetical protein